jgi:4-aminobutyrate aminotransferase / (S)-3-amino-2-methylpropionate transaminase / 5-aminovalerate transaminase
MERFKAYYEHFPIVGDVRGLGAMAGMDLVVNRNTKEPATAQTKQLVDYGREKGLLMAWSGTHSNVIRPLMPIVIGDELLEQGLSIIEEGLVAVSR